MSRPDTRVAVIEDDADIAYTIRLNLEREGYAVTAFGNGQEYHIISKTQADVAGCKGKPAENNRNRFM